MPRSKSQNKSEQKIYYPKIGVDFRRDDETYAAMKEMADHEKWSLPEFLRRAAREFLIQHGYL